jgi:hypothetical protein
MKSLRDLDEERPLRYWANNNVGNNTIPTGRIKYDKYMNNPIKK